MTKKHTRCYAYACTKSLGTHVPCASSKPKLVWKQGCANDMHWSRGYSCCTGRTPALAGCIWKLTERNKYCDTSATKDFGRPILLATCQAKVAADPSCTNVMFGNGDNCYCVKTGKTCSLVWSSVGNNVYTQVCTGTSDSTHSVLRAHVCKRCVCVCACSDSVCTWLAVFHNSDHHTFAHTNADDYTAATAANNHACNGAQNNQAYA